jgi:hypothetical protein
LSSNSEQKDDDPPSDTEEITAEVDFLLREPREKSVLRRRLNEKQIRTLKAVV